MEERKAINPFHVGAVFTNYCIQQGWLTLEFDEETRMHYYVTPEGERELGERFGMYFDSPCALEGGCGQE